MRRLIAIGMVLSFMALASTLQAQTADIELVALTSPSAGDVAPTVPPSESFILDDAAFVVEVWAQTTEVSGLSSVSADLSFDPLLANVTTISPSSTFDVLTHGAIDNALGTVDDLSGSHLGPCTDAIGVVPNWARVAILDATALASGVLIFQSAPTESPIYNTSICGVGDMIDAQIAFGSVTVHLVECLSDPDCADGQFCNGAETCNLVTHTCQPGTPPTCDDLIDCTVDFCDPLANAGAGGCVNTPNDGSCSDGVDCTLDVCDQLGVPGTGCSNTPNDGACDDLIDCTDDACDQLIGPGTGCSNVANNANCTDLIDCTLDVCDQLGAPGTGCSYTPDDAACDDLVACTLDTCDQLGTPGTGCSNAPDDAFCDNGLFCDGLETCDAIQGCLAGLAQCTADCEHCLEDTDSCGWCVFDLDASTVMGTGDFSLFAPCFGACYASGDPCLDSNFDDDLSGCVGTADFASFAGCFGLTCGECPACPGPEGLLTTARGTGSGAEFRLTALPSPSAFDTSTTVPSPQTSFDVGASVFLEVWVQTTDVGGLSSASVDISFDPVLATGVSIAPTTIFPELLNGLLDNGTGLVDDLSGSHLGPCSDAVAVSPDWARMAVVEFTADTDGAIVFEALQTNSPVYGTAVCGVGDIDPVTIVFDSLSVNFGGTVLPPTVGDDVCDGGTNAGNPCSESAECPGGACGSKNRYVSFNVPEIAARMAAGVPYAVRIEILSMPLFPARVGEVWWGGPSVSLPNPPFGSVTGSELECTTTPHMQVWDGLGIVHFFGEAVIPESVYGISLCTSATGPCSPPTTIQTGQWGDVVAAFGGPAQPNFADITAVVDSFKGLASAPPVVRTDLVPQLPDHVANFADITAAVDGFKGSAHPFVPPPCP